MMYALRVKGTDWWLPKTPYTEEEMFETNLLTNKPNRIKQIQATRERREKHGVVCW